MNPKEIETWLSDGLKLTESLVDAHKVSFAKRLKKLGVELIYGAHDLPISVTFKSKTNPIKKDSKLWEALRHIDFEIWNKA